MSNLIISNQAISQHNGFYSLNDLHRASGQADKHKPTFFLRNDQTKELIAEIESENQIAYDTVVGKGKKQGTYACRELVYAYAMWINPKFSLMVIRAFDAINGEPAQTKTTVAERTPLRQAVSALVGKKGLAYNEAYDMVNQYMGTEHIDEIPLDKLPTAIAYVHSLTMGTAQQMSDNVAHLVWHTAHIYRWYKEREDAFYALSSQIASGVHDHIIHAKAAANRLHRELSLDFNPDCPRRIN